MHVITGGRRSGKTYRMVEWVKQGSKTDTYPGWSRVLIVFNQTEAERLRKDYDLDYHQIFTAEEWRNRFRQNCDPSTEVGIDNADDVLAGLLLSRPAMASMVGPSVSLTSTVSGPPRG